MDCVFRFLLFFLFCFPSSKSYLWSCLFSLAWIWALPTQFALPWLYSPRSLKLLDQSAYKKGQHGVLYRNACTSSDGLRLREKLYVRARMHFWHLLHRDVFLVGMLALTRDPHTVHILYSKQPNSRSTAEDVSPSDIIIDGVLSSPTLTGIFTTIFTVFWPGTDAYHCCKFAWFRFRDVNVCLLYYPSQSRA